MRAVASVYVVLFHAVLGFTRGELEGAWRALRRAFAFGHEAVAVFIVLSGYCLMLPVVRQGGAGRTLEFGRFIGRRARRILPPYYATLLFTIALIAAVPPLRRAGSGTIWDDSLPGLEFWPIASHLLLLHNWDPAWAFQINGPLWSVATEWQIYFFFPLCLLPVWRRFGLPALIALAALIGYAPLWLFPERSNAAIPWYLLLFCLGMAAAAVVHAERSFERHVRAGAPWGAFAAVSWAAVAVFGLGFGSLWFRMKPATDVLVGFATASFLVHAALAPTRASRPLLALFSAPPSVAVGRFSYSLYLTHLPLLSLLHFALLGYPMSTEQHALALLVLGVPGSLGFAWLFYRLIERHFLNAPARSNLVAKGGPAEDRVAPR